MKCVYCDLPEIKERTTFENDLAWAFPTNIPVVPGHMLICPKRHLDKLDDLTREELDAILDLRIKLKLALKKVFGAEGFDYAWNEGISSGQSVPHLHIHMLPRKSGDIEIIGYDPRETLYRPSGKRKVVTEEKLIKVSSKIKEA